MKRVRHNVRPGMLSARSLNGVSLDLQIVISVDASHHTVRCELLRTTLPTGTRVEHYAAKSRDIRDRLDIIQDT